MKFVTTLIAVKSIARSRRFYEDLFGLKVSLDLGRNVTFENGFTLQQDFAWIAGLDEEDVIDRPNNMELYFEVDDFEAFIGKLQQHHEVEYVHPPKRHDWLQRVVRIYDPDGHIVEIGESMQVIARRCIADGYSVEETAHMIQHPVEQVKQWISQE